MQSLFHPNVLMLAILFVAIVVARRLSDPRDSIGPRPCRLTHSVIFEAPRPTPVVQITPILCPTIQLRPIRSTHHESRNQAPERSCEMAAITCCRFRE